MIVAKRCCFLLMLALPASSVSTASASDLGKLVKANDRRDLCIFSARTGITVVQTKKQPCDAELVRLDALETSSLRFNFHSDMFRSITENEKTADELQINSRLMIQSTGDLRSIYLQPFQAPPYLAIAYKRNETQTELLIFAGVTLAYETQEERLIEPLGIERLYDAGLARVRHMSLQDGHLVEHVTNFTASSTNVDEAIICLDKDTTIVSSDTARSLLGGSQYNSPYTVSNLPAADRIENPANTGHILRFEQDAVIFFDKDNRLGMLMFLQPKVVAPALCAYVSLH